MYSHQNDIISTASASSLPEQSITGERLLASLRYATEVIADHREQLNSMNVFPVPDGDTGTNMSMTMRAAIDAIGDEEPGTLAADRVASTFAFGALMGARGNSGVILSQILRGFANSIDGKTSLTAADIVAGIGSSATSAYKAVITPVEGTMLTVIKGAAAAANAALVQGGGILDILDAAAEGAAESLSHTPEMLEVLQRARVVDAGGQGVAYMLRAVANHVRGDLGPIQIGDLNPVPFTGNDAPEAIDGTHEGSGFCTNFVVFGNDLDLDELGEAFGAAGDSTVVIGDRSVVKIHIHTDRPDQVLALAMTFGRLDRVSIDNMDRQIELIAATANRQPAVEQQDFDIIAFAAGSGQAKALLSVGATSVLRSSPLSSISLDKILEAVESSPSSQLLLIPNCKTNIADAIDVAKRSDKEILVVEAECLAGQLAALSGLTLTHSLEAAAEQMRTQAKSEQSFEISFVQEIGYVALLGGETESIEATVIDAFQSGLIRLNVREPEICTIFTGREATSEDTTSLLNEIVTTFPDSDVETVDGGQVESQFIIVFE